MRGEAGRGRGGPGRDRPRAEARPTARREGAPRHSGEGGSRTSDRWVVESLTELADLLVSDFDLVDLLSLLSERCVELLDAAEAGLLLAHPDGTLHVMASSSERMHNLELFEVQRAEGPCLEVLESGRAVVNASLMGDGRWPSFAPRARAVGYRTVHALPVRHNGSVIGVVNLFEADEAHLAPKEVAVAQALADIASLAVVQDRARRHTQEVADQLQMALQARVAVEEAKGVLSEQLSVDVDAAFRLLRRCARNRNERIAEVARLVVDRELEAPAVVAGARASTARRSPRRRPDGVDDDRR